MKPKSSLKFRTLLLPAFVVCAISHSQAALVIWDGSDSTIFSDGPNWVAGAAPADDLTTDTAQFSGAPTANQPAVTANRSVGGLQFDTDGWIMGGGSILKVGSNGILANGNTTINTSLQVRNDAALNPGLPGAISAAAGKTLNLGKIASDANSNAAVQFNSGGNTGTISMNGTSDNANFSGTLLAGKIILNKGTLGGTTDAGSSFSGLTIQSGAIAEFGPNLTDRNGATARGRGQIFATATVNGTLDLKGNGTFSDNWGIGGLAGASSGLVTNNGTGAAQLRVITGNTIFSGNLNDGTAPIALRVDLDLTANSLAFNNATANTYSGGTEIFNGEYRIRNDNSLGAVPASPTTNIVINGAGAKLMNFNGAVTVNANRTIQIGASGGGFKGGYNTALTINGIVTGVGKVIIAPDNGAVEFLNASNNYSGGTEINGVLRVSTDGGLGAVPATVSTNITMNNAAARLMNRDSDTVVNANRTIDIGGNGGGFQAGWSKTLTVAGAITGTGPVNIAPDSGTVFFNGINTYTGNTVLNASRLTLSDNAQMLFKLGANGVSNSISGTGANTLNLSGDFVIDMALASIANGNVWTLVDVGTVSASPFKSTFSVVGFTEAADVWTMNSGSNNWTFRESNGQLSLMVVPEPSVTVFGAFGALVLLRRRR